MADLTQDDPRLEAINRALDYLLMDDHQLKQRWWTSANKAFDGSTPQKVYETDPSRVSQYIIKILEY